MLIVERQTREQTLCCLRMSGVVRVPFRECKTKDCANVQQPGPPPPSRLHRGWPPLHHASEFVRFSYFSGFLETLLRTRIFFVKRCGFLLWVSGLPSLLVNRTPIMRGSWRSLSSTAAAYNNTCSFGSSVSLLVVDTLVASGRTISRIYTGIRTRLSMQQTVIYINIYIYIEGTSNLQTWCTSLEASIANTSLTGYHVSRDNYSQPLGFFALLALQNSTSDSLNRNLKQVSQQQIDQPSKSYCSHLAHLKQVQIPSTTTSST